MSYHHFLLNAHSSHKTLETAVFLGFRKQKYDVENSKLLSLPSCPDNSQNSCILSMSVRQRRRLREVGGVDSGAVESEESEEDPPVNSQMNFHLLEDESDEEPTADAEMKEEESIKETLFSKQSLRPVPAKSLKKKSQPQVDQEVDFNELSLSMEEANTQNIAPKTRLYPWMEVSIHDLSMDSILLRRFGAQVIQNQQNRKRHLRKYLFTPPQEGWIRPPHKILSVEVCDPPDIPSWLLRYYDECTWVRFHWSEEYRQLHRKYDQVQGSGDVNLLCHFLSQYPYHIEGFLQLVSQPLVRF